MKNEMTFVIRRTSCWEDEHPGVTCSESSHRAIEAKLDLDIVAHSLCKECFHSYFFHCREYNRIEITYHLGYRKTVWLKTFKDINHLTSFIRKAGDCIITMNPTKEEYKEEWKKTKPRIRFGFPHPVLMEQTVGEIEIYDDYRE